MGSLHVLLLVPCYRVVGPDSGDESDSDKDNMRGGVGFVVGKRRSSLV